MAECLKTVGTEPTEQREGGNVPTGIRTRVSALKGPRPRPLDDGDQCIDDLAIDDDAQMVGPLGIEPRTP